MQSRLAWSMSSSIVTQAQFCVQKRAIVATTMTTMTMSTKECQRTTQRTLAFLRLFDFDFVKTDRPNQKNAGIRG
jgi:hypothetical protein